MRHLRAFALFWWDFIVGDDYRLAVGVVVALAATSVLTRAGIPAWWLVPLAVVVMLGISVGAAARRSANLPRTQERTSPPGRV